MKERILLIGSGGREMSLLLAIMDSPSVEKIFVAPGSDAMAAYAECCNVAVDDIDGLVTLAEKKAISLVIVGPEAPLALGIADKFEAAGIDIFAPKKEAARLESSKNYAKSVMAKAGVPTGRYKLAHSIEEGYNFFDECNYPIVLKQDGLRAGKGVTICGTRARAESIFNQDPPTEEEPILFEEYLEGFEFSLICLANGQRFLPLPVAQDYKTIYDNQQGPNTGGMGAVSPVPQVTDDIYQEALDKVIKPVLKTMDEEGNPFTGFLYAGLMFTNEGVKVIEFNARLGDPETEVTFPRLDGDFVAAIRAILDDNKTMEDAASCLNISQDVCLGVVLASPGYPVKIDNYPFIPDDFFEQAENARLTPFHMGTKRVAGGWQANGGRVVILTCRDKSISDCRKRIYRFLDQEAALISAFQYRTDIGLDAE